MAVLTNNVYAKELTDRLGIGVTLNPDGSVATVNGVTIRRVVGSPSGVETGNAGDLALSTSGILFVSQGGTTWAAVTASPAGGDPVTLRGALQNQVNGFAASTNTEQKFTTFQPVLPAAALTAGSVIRVLVSGTIKAAGATTVRFRIYGTDTLDGAFADYTVTNPLNNSPFRLETTATLSGVPPAAVRFTQLGINSVAGPTTVVTTSNGSNNPFPSVDPSAVTLTVTFGVSDPGNNVDISQFVVEMGVN